MGKATVTINIRVSDEEYVTLAEVVEPDRRELIKRLRFILDRLVAAELQDAAGPRLVYISHDDIDRDNGQKQYGVGVYDARTGELVERFYDADEDLADAYASDFVLDEGYILVEPADTLPFVPGEPIIG